MRVRRAAQQALGEANLCHCAKKRLESASKGDRSRIPCQRKNGLAAMLPADTEAGEGGSTGL